MPFPFPWRAMAPATIIGLMTLFSFPAALGAQVHLGTEGVAPPVAPRIPKDVTVHGDRRIDDYFWLRDRTNPAVLDYLRAEDRYTEAAMAPTKPLQDRL